MNENETVETVVVAAEKPGKKPKTKDKEKAKEKPMGKIKSKPARAKSGTPANPSHDFDFVGKVDSLRVRSGAGAEGFEFGLRGRHGKRRHFRFDTTDAFAMNAMAHLVLAAHANDSKLGIRTADEVDGIFIVRDIESRPKLGK